MVNLLALKPNTKIINPQKLGYVLKDGTINFADNDTAFEYVINAVQKGLKAEKPYERLVYWKNNRIYGIANGTKDQVKPLNNMPNGCSMMHGHPREFPLSVGDYNYLLSHDNVIESYAICPLGHYSHMVKLPGESVNNESTVRKAYLLNKIHRKYVPVSIIKYAVEMSQLLVKLIGKKIIGTPFYHVEIEEGKNKALAKAFAKSIDKTWKKYSGDKSGVIYESNFKF